MRADGKESGARPYQELIWEIPGTVIVAGQLLGENIN